MDLLSLSMSKKSQCIAGQTTAFWQEQLKELDYDFTAEFNRLTPAEQAICQNFIRAFGCFDRTLWFDNNGNPTQIPFGQKASAVLRKLLQNDNMAARGYPNARLQLRDFCRLCADLPANAKTNQAFVNFLGHGVREGNVTRYPNLELLLKMEAGYEEYGRDYENPNKFVTRMYAAKPGIFQKTMLHFDNVKKLSYKLDNTNMPQMVQRVEAIDRFYKLPSQPNYQNVNDDNRALAELFHTYDLSQTMFDKANALFNQAKDKNVPAHILGVPLGEPQGSQNFTYEMLDKYHPANPILGLMTGCCFVLGSFSYGGAMVRLSVIDPTVQNMVVRNRQGQIVAKGTLVVKAATGKIVFNDFEMHDDYRSEHNKEQETARTKIFAAFMRGIDAVIKQYNTLHQQPLEFVLVGGLNNKLSRICKTYPVAGPERANDISPDFKDAYGGAQYILYQRAAEKNPANCQAPSREL